MAPGRNSTLDSETQRPLYVGMDFGSSGSRAVAVNEGGAIVASASVAWSDNGNKLTAAAPESWRRALFSKLEALGPDVCGCVRGVAIDGTSSTALLIDGGNGCPLPLPVKMYDEAQPQPALKSVAAVAPEGHTVRGATSTLAKLVSWDQQGALRRGSSSQVRLVHQADWMAGQLHGQWDVSDWHNALKLGFDPGAEQYPPWLLAQEYAAALPQKVVQPGTPVGQITAEAAKQSGLPSDCVVCGGTTDSIAAFLAACAGSVPSTPGMAVTSLGSTLAVKLLSDTRVDDAQYGVYSHRLGNLWLVGGASNSGGAVLRKFFTNDQLVELTERIDMSRSPQLGYYPLTKPGERFPVADPQLPPRLEPRPSNDVEFLHGLLEGIADIEADAYNLLSRMGATALIEVLTAGGGARNDKWTAMRAAKLGVPVRASDNGDAAYGAALLCRDGLAEKVMHR